VTTEFADWATECPEYKVTAVQVRKTSHASEWQESQEEFREETTRRRKREKV
jgi:formate dehydrogenase major subunit